MSRTKIKICGLKRPEDIIYVNELKPDYIGFILAEGRSRTVDIATAGMLKEQLDPRIQAVGVFLDQPIDYILQAVKAGAIDMIQLHGKEDNEYIEELRRRLKAETSIAEASIAETSIAEASIAETSIAETSIADAHVETTALHEATALSDTAASPAPAALPCIIKAASIRSSEDIDVAVKTTADLLLLDNKIPGSGQSFDWTLLGRVARPYILAGGLNSSNIKEALRLGPFAVDVSSGVETDGIKDYEKMKAFLQAVRNEEII